MLSFRSKLIVAGLAVLLLLAVGGYLRSNKSYPHVTKGPDGKFYPDAGYRWVAGNEKERRVVWNSGSRHGQYSHVFAAQQEGYWYADEGYRFLRSNDLGVVWSPLSSHREYPHISAAQKQDYWIAEAGYRFPFTNDLRVVWSAGRRHPSSAHISAAEREGYWRPDTGYVFVSSDSLETQWVSGRRHSYYPNVIASGVEGSWIPAAGFQWVDSASGDLTVVGNDFDETAKTLGGMALKGIVAYFADRLGEDRLGDGSGKRFGRTVSREVRDELLKSAIDDAGKLIK